jgi:site-specific recombinase XerD
MEMDFIGEYKADLIARHECAEVVRQYPYIIQRLSRFVHGDLISVNEHTMVDYSKHLGETGISFSTTKHYFMVISDFYEFLLMKKLMSINPVSNGFKKRYIHPYKEDSERRRILTVDEARRLVKTTVPLREKIVVLTMLTTGMRRNELSSLDIDNLDLPNSTIRVKKVKKRSNRVVFIDDPTRLMMVKWVVRRAKLAKNTKALFLDSLGRRISPDSVNTIFKKYGEACGLHNPDSDELDQKLTSHCARHFFSNYLVEAGMSDRYVGFLRGDKPPGSIGPYHHPLPGRVKEVYMALFVPHLI